MLPEKLKREDLFQVQRLPRWLFGVIAVVAVGLIILPIFSGRPASPADARLTVELPSPQLINPAAALPGLSIGWAYTAESTRQTVRGETFRIHERATVCYGCGTAAAILGYFDTAFAEDDWTRREGGCTLAAAAGQIVLDGDATAAYSPPVGSGEGEACALVYPTGQSETFRVVLLMIEPA
jgi:hypothetical protein